ncbi:MAG: diacylglycerol kinase family lipid kinase [Cohnella sp.]|nr:diacylglycerol kinase family lipid kinase [Cohnella sp.]
MILFVVNVKSGNGRGKRVWQTVEQELIRLGTQYAKIIETSPEAALRQAESRMKRGDIQAVAAVGGDGTLHSILPLGIFQGLPIGLIPCGSGNDTARAFGLPEAPLAALPSISRKR